MNFLRPWGSAWGYNEMAQSNESVIELIHSVEELLKGTKICAHCLDSPVQGRLRVESEPVTARKKWCPRWLYRRIVKRNLHWYCPNCGKEWKERRIWNGPKGTVTPIDEEVFRLELAV